jgi:signal transduction histidine kinase
VSAETADPYAGAVPVALVASRPLGKEPGTVLRRSLLAVPLVAVLAALAGAALAARPVLAVVLAGSGGLAVAALVARAGERRAGAVADRVTRFAEGDIGSAPPLELRGSREWQRLLGALNAVGTSLQERFDELAGERARIERILDGLPTAILLFTGRDLAYANPAARSLFRVGRQEARTPLQVLGVEALADAVTEARETGRDVEVEVQRAERELVARASVTDQGEVALVVSDLTESKRVEAIRRDFVTNASHELKTPVAGMQALSESLSLAIDRDPDRARTMIGRLHLEAERLAQLVRELLDLARLEEAAGPQGRHRVDLSLLVRVQADRLRRLAAERDVDIRTDCPTSASVITLPEDLRLIVSNLLENAVRYNRPGGEVVASVRREGSDVVLEVADTGLGIPDADRDRIFERFYRVDKARSRAAGGTGLGLSIVRHAVHRHGGDITVSSVLGEGSTFRVVLPVEGER